MKIRYCGECGWLLRTAWMAQELLTTFADVLEEVTLAPAAEGGTFQILCNGDAIWDRRVDGGFPDVRTLKQRVRDRLSLARDLGHLDRSEAR